MTQGHVVGSGHCAGNKDRRGSCARGVREGVCRLPACPTGRHSVAWHLDASLRQQLFLVCGKGKQPAGPKACTVDAGEGMGMGIACNARPSTSTNATT